jgi:sulfur-oxidizing protein SoxY
MNRRHFLKDTFVAALAAGLAPAMLMPPRVLAAWPRQAFLAQNAETALRTLLGGTGIQVSTAVILDAPPRADNGALVPITIATDLEGAESITLVSEPNPFPLVANFRLTPRVHGPFVTRIRMGGSGDVVAIVGSGGRYYSAQRTVQVVAGGC